MRIINIELHGVKKVRHLSGRRVPSIDQILAFPPDEHLTRHIHLLVLFIPHRTKCFFFVVEHNGNTGLVDACLALFVDELRQVPRTDLREVGNTEDEAYGVENVGLSGSIETRDGIEVWIKSEAM